MRKQFYLILIPIVFLAACGKDGDNTVPIEVSQSGILLEGDSASPAKDAIKDYDSGDRTSDDEISTDADGMLIDRTNISISFIGTATVGDINALLDSIDGKIVGMLQAVNIILVKIPDPGNLEVLDSIIEQIKSKPIVKRVTRATMEEVDALPINHDWLSDLNSIDHNIAVLAPAAWNAKAALEYENSLPPILMQIDYFGGGTPNGDYDINAIDTNDFSVKSTSSLHGYHVLGIVSGKHNDDAAEKSERQNVTGIYPGKVSVRIVDRRDYNRPASENRIVTLIKEFNWPVVLNTSLNSGCPRPPTLTCVEPRTLDWIEKVRGSTAFEAGVTGELEKRFIHLTSSGNFRGEVVDSTDASLNSQYSAAKLLPGLQTTTGVAIPNVSNTMVVENRVNTNPPNTPGCLDDSSKFPGDISAIGTNVWSFTGKESGAKNLTGTSMATPQVAGLAAYLWALKPSLSPQEVMDILETTASISDQDATCSVVPTPVIDAYAAVLSADKDSVLNLETSNPFDAPARLAILDIANNLGEEGENKAFDHHDLSLFIQKLETFAGFNLDYSRYDLNGDGFTGGTEKTTRFNLDIDPANIYRTIDHEIDGETVSFNEDKLSDWDILCFYSYSPLFTGDNAQRDSLLAPHKQNCGATPNTARILFNRATGVLNNQTAIFSMNSSGGNIKKLTDDSAFVSVSSAIWSPDFLKVAYIKGIAGNKDIWVMDRDGTNQINLINDLKFPADTSGSDRDDASHQWSPDSSKILFLRARNISDKVISFGGWIYVMNADGTNRVKLTPDEITQSDIDPTWSPDGNKIAFIGFREDKVGLFIINADGSNPVHITDQISFGSQLAWSAGGSKIYFSSISAPEPGKTGNRDVYSINSNGADLRNLTNSPQNEDVFTLSPEGSKIAYLRSGFGIFISSSIDGSNEIKIPNSEPATEDFLWSPDSTEILFSTGFEIFLTESNGDNQRKLETVGGSLSDWK